MLLLGGKFKHPLPEPEELSFLALRLGENEPERVARGTPKFPSLEGRFPFHDGQDPGSPS